jgi:AcrR family transcriptional regulator
LTFQFVNLKMFVMGIAERKSRQKQALRERILDAARRIVMREGFTALSMRKIADAIEYSPATLYLHFASRDEIAHALCAEGYAQLLETFVPLADVIDPAERLKALGRAYVAFGVANPETYRLIFMEDQSYMGAALGGASAGKAKALAEDQAAATEADTAASATGVAAAMSADNADNAPGTTDDDPGAAALQLMIAALEELKAAGRLPASTDLAVWAEAFWATLHGIVALNLTCPVFPTVSLETVVSVALDAWLGTAQAAQQGTAQATPQATRQAASRTARRASRPRSVSSTAGAREPKLADLQTASSGEATEPTDTVSSSPSDSEPTQTSVKKTRGPATKRKTTST